MFNPKVVFGIIGGGVAAGIGYFGGTKKGRGTVKKAYESSKKTVTDTVTSSKEKISNTWQKAKFWKKTETKDNTVVEKLQKDLEDQQEYTKIVENELTQTKSKYQQLSETHTNLSTAWDKKVKDFDLMEKDNESLQNKIDELEDAIGKKDEMLTTYQNTVDDLEKKLKEKPAAKKKTTEPATK